VEEGVRWLSGEEEQDVYLSDEERRSRIIEVVQRGEGLECPELVVHGIVEGLGPTVVNYACKEGEPSRELRFSEEQAVYVCLADPPGALHRRRSDRAYSPDVGEVGFYDLRPCERPRGVGRIQVQ
jgi:hypothetical protein